MSHKTGASTAGHARRADIQGLRAIAVLMVIVFHACVAGSENPGGTFTGVDVFFVISGFVITGSLVARPPGTVRTSLASFYARRARRILPALALVIVVVAVLSMIILSPLGPQQHTANTGAAASVFAANAQLYRLGTGYFALNAHTNPLLHTWSLAVEEQLYLVFPTVVFISWSFGRRYERRLRMSSRQILFIVLSVGVAVSFALSSHWSAQHRTLAFYSSPTRAWEFGVGALLALVAPTLLRIPRGAAAIIGAAGGALLVLTVFSITPATEFPGAAALLPVGGAALLIAAGAAANRGVGALLSTPPAVWLGDRSYSWYLWHWPAIVFARTLWHASTWELLVVGAASIVPAGLSYRYVENPIRFDAGYVGRRAMKLAAVCIAFPLVASGGLALVGDVASRSDVVRSIARDVQPLHADVVRGCDIQKPLGARRGPACTWRVEDPLGDVVLIGDSNAGQFTEPVTRAANRSSFNAEVATASGCPFVDLVVESSISPLVDCGEFAAASVVELARRRPSLVIIASASSEYINDDQLTLSDPKTGAEASSPSSKAAMWTSALGSVLRALDRAGVPTVVLHVVPHYPAFAPEECPAIRMYLDAASCGSSLTRREVSAQRRRALAAESQALSTAPSAAGVDLIDQLCTRHSCSARRDERWIYRDAQHLSIRGARALTDELAEVIDMHARLRD